MASDKSLCSFLRATLGLKGTTTHNGAGAFILEIPCTWEEFSAKIEAKLDGWINEEKVDHIVLMDDECIRLLFDEDTYGGYNNLFAHKSQFQNEGHGSVSVHMDIF